MAAPFSFGKTNRDKLGRDVLSFQHDNILGIFLVTFATVNIVRALVCFYTGWVIQGVVLAATGLILLGVRYRFREVNAFKLKAFVCAHVILLAEAYLTYSGFKFIFHYLLVTHLTVAVVAIMSGMGACLITSVFGLAVGAWLVLGRSPLENFAGFEARFESTTVSFYLYLTITQLLMVFLMSQFNKFVDKSESELISREEERGRLLRRKVMGETVGRLAHEINNPLAILTGAARILMGPTQIYDIDRRARTIAYMEAARARLLKVIYSVGQFSDVENEPIQTLTCGDVIAEFRLVIDKAYPHRSEHILKIFVDSELSFQGRRSQILFTLKVLLDNAVEASGFDFRHLVVRILSIPDQIRFEVENQGNPIAEDVFERICTPFFTTKPVGESIGMNLSIARSMIQSQGGNFSFSSNKDCTVFRFDLPRAFA